MKIASMFKKGKTVFSLEVFPPKKTSSIDTIYDTLDQLHDLHPDFISVTYGAAGNPADQSTCEIASIIKHTYHIEPLAHLTCVNTSKANAAQILSHFQSHEIENIMALRGDINPDVPPEKDFRYASDLIRFIKDHGDFGISGACYPEVHIEAPDMVHDLRHLKQKVDSGAEHLVSQLFFDNRAFYAFREKAQIAGIGVPIEAGIMPVVNKKQIERMVSLCGASLPVKFTKMMQRYEQHPQALRDAGIAYAIDQIVDLIANGVDGIHLYTMNNPYVARRISEQIGSLLQITAE